MEKEKERIRATDFEAKMKIRLMAVRKIFIHDKLSLLDDIDLSQLENNLEQAKSLGHQIKGSAATFSYENLSLLGAQIEEAAKEKKSSEVKEYLVDLRKILEKEAKS